MERVRRFQLDFHARASIARRRAARHLSISPVHQIEMSHLTHLRPITQSASDFSSIRPLQSHFAARENINLSRLFQPERHFF